MDEISKKVAKRMKTHKKSLEKLMRLEEKDSQVQLVRSVAWKIFGFAEIEIVEMEDSLIGVESSEELQYAIEICPLKTPIPDQLSSKACMSAYEKKLRYYVQTNGVDWKMFEAIIEEVGQYKIRGSVTLKDLNLDSNDFLSSLIQFCSELNQRAVDTDKNNRKRWYGYWSEDKQVAAYLFLVEFLLYADLSERVHIPLLGLTLWGDKPFDARNRAWASIDKYISENLEPVSNGTFVTTAYKGETTPLQKMVSFEREVSSDNLPLD